MKKSRGNKFKSNYIFLLLKLCFILLSTFKTFSCPSRGQENENEEYFIPKDFEIKCSYTFKTSFLQLFFKSKYCQPMRT